MGSIPGQGTYLVAGSIPSQNGCDPQSRHIQSQSQHASLVWVHRETRIDVSLSHQCFSLSSSFPSSLSKKASEKNVQRQGLKNKIKKKMYDFFEKGVYLQVSLYLFIAFLNNLYFSTNLTPLLRYGPSEISIMSHVFNEVFPLWLKGTRMVPSPVGVLRIVLLMAP